MNIKCLFLVFVCLIIGLVVGFVFHVIFFDKSNLQISSNFRKQGYLILDSISCKQIRSTDPKSVGEQLTITNLNSDNPKVVFGNRSGGAPMKKVFEDKQTLVIQQIASGTGSTDTITVDKEGGTFARSFAGNFVGVYAGATIGTCN